jgi:DNA polymerase I
MSILEQARKAYAKVVSQRNGRHELTPAPQQHSHQCNAAPIGSLRNGEISEISEESPSVLMLVNDPADLPIVLTAIDESVLVGLDTETTGLDSRAGRVRLLSLATDRGTYLIDCFRVDPAPLWDALAEKPLVAHNGLFDLQFLRALGFEPGEVRDTMLESQVLYAGDRAEMFKYGLADCVKRELGQVLDKAEQAGDWSGALTPEQLRYAALDTDVLVPLHDALAKKLDAAGLTRAADIERRCLPAITWLASTGVGFDQAAWDALATDAAAERDRLRGELDAAAPVPSGRLFAGLNWDSPEQVQDIFAQVGVALGNTDDDALAAADHPLAELLRRYRSAAKRATTYGPGWVKHAYRNGRLYPGWRQIGAGSSGRMSCAEPNCQNLPRDVRYRRCFVAPPGRLLVKADYSQIELRIAAKVADEARMIDAYRRGDDLHALTARQILGKTDVTKADRQLAKAVNFGLLYGMGARSLRVYARSNYGVELTEDDAKRYRDLFFRTYPGLRRWHRRTPDADTDTRTLTGRRCLRVKHFSEKLNMPVQGTGADGLKLAMALLWERRADCPGAVPVLAVHDEIVVECDTAQADAASTWLKQAMLDAMTPLVEPVPVEVEVSVAPTWGG